MDNYLAYEQSNILSILTKLRPNVKPKNPFTCRNLAKYRFEFTAKEKNPYNKGLLRS